MTTKAQADAVIPALSGPNVGIATLLDQIITNLNAASTATAAHATVTIGGTAHLGDQVTITVNGFSNFYTSQAPGTAASGTATVGGTVEVGDVLEVTVAGNLVVYSLVAGDTTTTIAATSLAAALNANATFAASYVATSSAAVVTVTALLPGTAGNVTLACAVSGHTPTTTLTASGANLTGGAAGDTLNSIANNLVVAINADPNAGGLVTATRSGAVITLTSKLKGPQGSAYTLAAAVTGSGATVTATAQGSTLGAGTAGTGNNDVILIV